MRAPGRTVRGGALFAVVSCLLAAGAAAQTPPAAAAPVLSPSAGDVLPAFVADKLDGQSEYVDFPRGSATVLLFFLSSCPHCHEMIPKWNKAFETKPARIKMIAVLMDQEPPGFFLTRPVSFPVVGAPGRAFLDSINVRRVPLTLRVAPGGKIEDVALGIIDEDRLAGFFK